MQVGRGILNGFEVGDVLKIIKKLFVSKRVLGFGDWHVCFLCVCSF
jgi:hypothetical protein